MTEPVALVHPVILSGGSGTRLWPLSRRLYPKQFLPLAGKATLLQQTAARVGDNARFAAPVVVCNEEHRFAVAEQLRLAGIHPGAILLEPVGRNTAPAIALAALHVAAVTPEALLLILPSDHAIADPDGFLAMVEAGRNAAAAGQLVTFGIGPDRPDTGYGYIEAGEPVCGAAGALCVRRFVEKPDAVTAAGFLADGGYFWNSGMFLFRADAYLAELDRLQPQIADACRRASADSQADLDFIRPRAEDFAASPALSVDYAIMEHTDQAAVVPATIGWSDLGAWSALWDAAPKDAAGNAAIGEVVVEDVANSYLRADHRMIAAVGLDGMVVVATDDVVFVAPRDRAGEVRLLVERLAERGHAAAETHSVVYRPWGSYQTVDEGGRFKVKRLTVKPGAALSLQRHRHRAEHWVVVSGTARVTRGDEVLDLDADRSTYIPVGEVHRLANPGTEPLHIIEVQTGEALTENDIERLEDDYGRH